MRDKPQFRGQAGRQVGKRRDRQHQRWAEEADGYTWWQVDDGTGNVGWVAEGTKDDPWLSPERGHRAPATGGKGKLVNRAVRLGDRVQVTTQEGKMLTLREVLARAALPTARALTGHAIHRARRACASG